MILNNKYCLLQQDCPNGRLTPAKFVDMYKMFFPSGNAVEFCDHVFRTFDMDKNGYIDFKVNEILRICVINVYIREPKLTIAHLLVFTVLVSCNTFCFRSFCRRSTSRPVALLRRSSSGPSACTTLTATV